MIPLETVKQYAGQLKPGLLATLFYAPADGQILASDSQRELLLSTLWIQSALARGGIAALRRRRRARLVPEQLKPA
jgi:hypothetical protein